MCVGAHDASGECFRPNETTRGLHVGDCVQVTYETGVGKVRDQVRDVAAVDADSHPADCPG